eukprot:6101264-Pleurochrysis_carterae.AAC.1
MPPSYDEIVRTQEPLTLEVIENTRVDDYLAMLYRERVVDDWTQVVLMRTATDEFTIFCGEGDKIMDK